MTMATNLRPRALPAPVPAGAHSAPEVLSLMRARREALALHNARALPLASSSIGVLAAKLSGHAPAVRCDRQVRFRNMQLSGEKGLPFEDLVAIALEAQLGTRAVVEMLAHFLGQLGYAVTSQDPTAEQPGESLADVASAAGDLMAEGMRDLSDGRLDDDERRRLLAKAGTLREQLDEFTASVQK